MRMLTIITGTTNGHEHGAHCAHVPGARKEQGLLGFAAGFIPCSGAILILVFALTNGIVFAGIAMTLAIAVGMAITLSVMGVGSILVRRQIVLRLPQSAVASRALQPARADSRDRDRRSAPMRRAASADRVVTR